MKKLLFVLAGIIVLLVSIVFIRTSMFTAPELKTKATKQVNVDAQRVAEHLSQAIQFSTVSAQLKTQPVHDQFEGFINWLAKTYPEVHVSLQPKKLGQYSMLYTWQGTQADLPPILLSAHYDVVPVLAGSENLWSHQPFAGTIDQKHIWGRGALDDKSAVIALMEAATLLLAENFQPTRTVYLSLTHDEEIGGRKGTKAIVDHLKADDIRLAWSIDEGSFLLDGFFPGIVTPVANINIAEKGSLTVNIVAKGKGGHSSIPPRETAVGVLSKAIANLEAAPLSGTLDGLSGKLFDAIASHMPFSQRMLFANRWLFGDLIDSKLSTMSFTNAMLRTTTAPTMLSASSKPNVLAIEAISTVNFRVHPRDTLEGIVDHVNSVIGDSRVEVKLLGGRVASRVSSDEALGYQAIMRTVQDTYGNVIVAPGLTVAGTDSRHYEQIAENSYRFNPMKITPKDVTSFHGTNERISIENMVKATSFYNLLIKEGSSQ